MTAKADIPRIPISDEALVAIAAENDQARKLIADLQGELDRLRLAYSQESRRAEKAEHRADLWEGSSQGLARKLMEVHTHYLDRITSLEQSVDRIANHRQSLVSREEFAELTQRVEGVEVRCPV